MMHIDLIIALAILVTYPLWRCYQQLKRVANNTEVLNRRLPALNKQQREELSKALERERNEENQR